jgi:branched-chain amino acid transport system permease protein
LSSDLEDYSEAPLKYKDGMKLMIKRFMGSAALIIVALLIPLIITSPYHMHVIIMAMLNSIFAMGFLMILNVGLISLGQAAFVAIGGYSSSLLVMKLGLPFWAAFPLAGIITGFVALVFGLISVRMGNVPFLLLTFCFAEVIRLLIAYSPKVTGGFSGLNGIPRPEAILSIQFISKIPFFYLTLIVLVFTSLVFLGLYTSRVGGAFRAINLRENAASVLGIDVFKYRMLAFVIACFFTGLAGSLEAHYILLLHPDMFSVFNSLYIQIYAIVGGLGYLIVGPIVGAFFMTIIPEVIRFTKEIEPVIFGAILLLTVIFLRKGLMSLPGLILVPFNKIISLIVKR